MKGVYVVAGATTENPVGAPLLTTPASSAAAPSAEVIVKQDPEHTKEDFMGDLGRATQRREKPSRRARGSSKT
jgi:hypothetical protein